MPTTQKPTNQRQKKISEYGQQLREKQGMRNSYGLREKQFRRYFGLASKSRELTGSALLTLLERRLDNVVFRAGLATSRAHARQLVNHRHFSLNGKRVGIPSQLVEVGDVIEPYKKSGIEVNPETAKLNWLTVDKKALKITVKSLPESGELPIEFDTQKIIEFYSK